VEAGIDTLRRFLGAADRARFDSWCRSPHGWLERCTVTLTLIRQNDGAVLQAAWPGFVETLLAGKGPSGFRYLKSPADGGSWVRQWGDALTPPAALLIMTGRDTLFLRIGARG
jgi:hypothetical protein